MLHAHMTTIDCHLSTIDILIDWGPYGTTPTCYAHRYAMNNFISLSIVYPIVFSSYVLDTKPLDFLFLHIMYL